MSIWNQPGAVAYTSRDRIAKQLEIEAIAKYVKDGMTVLDVGCGDGETLLALAHRCVISGFGIDSSKAMLSSAWQNKGPMGKSLVTFVEGDICRTALQDFLGTFDLIYSERCLINLPDWETQKKAIGNIAKALKPGGLYVMLENSWEGLQFINDLREKVGLSRIEPPGHNRYLRDLEVINFAFGNGCDLEPYGIDDYSSTYYFLSRVVNAALTPHGQEPDYDSPINKLALSLPAIPGLRGQGQIWVWRKS